MGRGEDAHVDRDLGLPGETDDALGLQRGHQLGLRARRQLAYAVEVDLFAHLFALGFAARAGHIGADMSDEATAAVGKYEWPGNVRELRDAIRHAVAMSRGSLIDLTCLPEPLRSRASGRLRI